jgi:dipeptidase E
MKLLLTSAGLHNKKVSDCFISNLPKKPEDCSALMIAYTQDNEMQLYVDESKKELISLGISNTTPFSLGEEKFKNEGQYDVIYVCGGNTFAILDRLRTLGMDKFIIDSLKDDKALYIGVSAGSIIAGPSIEIAGWGSEGDTNDIGLKDLTGLNLTNVSVYPHFESRLKREVEDFRHKVKYPVIELTDEEAVLVWDLGYEIIK